MFLVIDCKIHSHDTKIKLAKMGNEAFGAWVLLAAYVRLNGTYDGQLEYGSLSNLFSILNINSYRKLKIILDQLCKSNWIQIDYQNCHIKIPKWLKYQRIFNLKALKAAAILEGKNATKNLVTCCQTCNSARGNRDTAVFATAVAKYLDHSITGDMIMEHIARCIARPLPMAEAKRLIAQRGSAAKIAEKNQE